jgi:hypothetical protein
MGSTILIGLGPALVRLYAQYLPQSWGMSGAVLLTSGTIEAILVVAIVLAFRRRQSLRPFLGLLAAFVLIQIGQGGYAQSPRGLNQIRPLTLHGS